MSRHRDFFSISPNTYKKVLDLGCGFDKKVPEAIGVDIMPTPETNLICNLDHYPWPFKENTFDLIVCSHIIEHITDVVKFIEEIYRIAKPNAIIKGITPHFSSAYSYADPTHKHHLSLRSFEVFCDSSSLKKSALRRLLNRLLGCHYKIQGFYPNVKFEQKQVCLVQPKIFRAIGVSWFANIFPELYESYLVGFFRGGDIYFELIVKK